MASGEHVYATLLLSDSYLPGALVLAHSLRDARTTKKLAVLVTLDSVSAESITQLKTVYDYVLPVPRICNAKPANLYLMNRGDLHSAFTKINLWKQTQFSKIVYIDADVMAYRACDELFNTPHDFAAAPDIGWPDLFNSGVMVLTPNMGDYYAMMAMAERGISFDGADQGLLNMHFKDNYHRLSFTYNVTPSAHYQYVPAYRHFQSSINMVHFIGSNKPWFAGRHAPQADSPFDEMIGRWWAVYDRHYRVQETAQLASSSSSYVQYFTKGEFQPQYSSHPSATVGHKHDENQGGFSSDHQGDFKGSHSSAEGSGEQSSHDFIEESVSSRDFAQHPTPPPPPPPAHSHQAVESEHTPQPQEGSDQHKPSDIEPQPQRTSAEVTMSSWDAQRQPPPADSAPEALNFPSTHYTMSQDTTPFVPPPRYPSPPKNMWYEVPTTPPTQQSKPVFPWEGHQPTPTRSFASETLEIRAAVASMAEAMGNEPDHQDVPHQLAEQPTTGAAQSESPGSNIIQAPEQIGNTLTEPSEPWSTFQLNNAWDEIPEISRYVDGLQKHRRGKSQTSILDTVTEGNQKPRLRQNFRSSGFKVTDFPSEVERPSLPVTPAPIARQSFWGNDEPESRELVSSPPLPAAEGVPAQLDWVCAHGRRWEPTDCLCELADLLLPFKDPEVQLQKLARQQYEALLRKLEAGKDLSQQAQGTSPEIPRRSLPFGSDGSQIDFASVPTRTPGLQTSGDVAQYTPRSQPASRGASQNVESLLESPMRLGSTTRGKGHDSGVRYV